MAMVGSHGTIVASVAAGQNLGVAPEATIIPIARTFTDDQQAMPCRLLRFGSRSHPQPAVNSMMSLASSVRDDYAKFDIINRSYGERTFPCSAVNWIRRPRNGTNGTCRRPWMPCGRSTRQMPRKPYSSTPPAMNPGDRGPRFGQPVCPTSSRNCGDTACSCRDESGNTSHRGLLQSVRPAPVQLECCSTWATLLPLGSRDGARPCA